MRKLTLFFSMFCIYLNVYSQDSLFSTMKAIKGDIILIGVSHGKNNLGEKNMLINSISSSMFCDMYPEILKNAGNRKIVFLLESMGSKYIFSLENDTKKQYHLPDCIPLGSTVGGCDPRAYKESKQLHFEILLSILSNVFIDSFSGKERKIKDFFVKKGFLNIKELTPVDQGYFYDVCPEVKMDNIEFENSILTDSYAWRQRGYFVVVFCGASHVLKMITTRSMINVGYAICIPNSELVPAIKSSKLLLAIEACE